MKRFLLLCGLLVVILAGYLAGALLGLYGRHEGPGEITQTPIPTPVLNSPPGWPFAADNLRIAVP